MVANQNLRTTTISVLMCMAIALVIFVAFFVPMMLVSQFMQHPIVRDVLAVSLPLSVLLLAGLGLWACRQLR